MSLRTLLLLWILLLPTIIKAQLGFALTRGQHRVQFPIEINNNLVVLPILLNGQLPLKFILDTGVRTTILTEKSFSDVLNLTYGRHYLISGPGGDRVVEAYVTNNVTLDLPGVHGEGHAMLVLEKDYLELRNYLGTDVQGVLGYEMFSRFVVEIDYERRMLTLILPEYFKPKKNFQTLHIKIEDTKPYLMTSVEINDTTTLNAKLLVDTGASHGLVLDPSTSKKIILPEKNIRTLIGRGIGGVITGEVGRIKSLELGKYRIRNPIANFPDANSYIDTLKASDIFRNGAVGGEVLSRFTTIFDFSNEKLYIKKNTSFKNSFNFNMSGLTLKAMGVRLRKFEVTDVRVDSPADLAGISNGDEVISINGIPTANLDLNTINSFFNSSPGKKIRLEILRGGEQQTKRFVLKNQI